MNPGPESPAADPRAWRTRLADLARRVLREPLTHFLAIGLVIFLGFAAVKAARRPVLEIDAQELTQLVAYWEVQMQRPPTKAELAGILRERVDEEILAREAQRLGLDRNDMIIRRRLAQKMAFAGEDVTSLPEPSEQQLGDYYAAHRARYLTPAQVSLQHIYFSDDRKGAPAEAAARQAAADAQAGRPPGGDPFVLPRSYSEIPMDDLNRDYGPAFAQAVSRAPVGRWTGPVRSAFGWHAVRVAVLRPARPQSFDDARSDVRDQWLAERRNAANAAFMDGLRRRYRIQVAGAEP